MKYFWPTKDPDSILDYSIDWSNWLEGDTLQSVDWFLPAGITKENQSNTTTVATVWLSGGADGNVYNIVCRIVTAGGRTDEVTIRLPVKNK